MLSWAALLIWLGNLHFVWNMYDLYMSMGRAMVPPKLQSLCPQPVDFSKFVRPVLLTYLYAVNGHM